MKHGGLTHEENLAYACLTCNRNKGSDISSIVPGTDERVRFFNPRTDRWPDYFRLALDGVTIVPLSAIGEATVRILGLNNSERLLEREALIQAGRYPTPPARKRIQGDI